MIDMVLQSHWVWSGLAHGLAFFILLRILVYGYREHSYLYQFESRQKALDTWIDFIMPIVKNIPARRYREFVTINLARAGTRKDWIANHFIASQLLYMSFTAVVSYITLILVLGLPFLLCFLISTTAFLLPLLRLWDIARSRYEACNRDLPYYLDYLSLAMGAGLDFDQALQRVVADAPKSPLAVEFARVLKNLRLGMSRGEALLEMDSRLNSPMFKLFVQTLLQGIELGVDIVKTLSSISESFQQRRFQLAEEKAGKISVRMLIPMILFLMPAVMIILLGPMALNYMQMG